MGARPKRHLEDVVDLRKVYASLRDGCRTCEEDSVEDKEGVRVLGAVNGGVTYDIAR